MNRWIVRSLGLGILAILLLVGLKQAARAQQEEERGTELDRLFDLTSYRGLEERPYFGEAPEPDERSLLAPDVNVPYSQIVFQSYRNLSDWEIFIANGDGSSQTQLTWLGSADIHARLNRGCTKIVFSSSRSGNYDIYTMNTDGSSVTQLTTNVKDDVYPAWSADGNMIAFQSYRNGNPEIFIMNADGSGQTRLTDSKDFDGMPAWSPDGRIAFSSHRTTGWGIYVMNQDGSGLTRVTSQSVSIYPAWSPDGSQIAYSADGDGSDWLELWLVNADGSNPHKIYELGYRTDTLAGSWAPDGQYIAYTIINYIKQGNYWYWTTAYLYAYDLVLDTPTTIIDNNTEWYPDWQTTDNLPPVSNVTALPAQSPAPIHLYWSGSDQGPTGIQGYDVQVKDGWTSTWTNWQVKTTNTSTTYPATGGHTYYFRVRARDNGGNVEAWPTDYDAFTTVEAYAPRAAVAAMPGYIPTWSRILWNGNDPGGSGIFSFDVQYRDTTSAEWVDWANDTTKIYAYLHETLGETYQFRARATDHAQNMGTWSSNYRYFFSTLCRWALAGSVYDNTGVPISNASLTTLPAVAYMSGTDGGYSACILDRGKQLTMDWNKDGYSQLPTTTAGQNQVDFDVALPPADNIVPNWGFSSGPNELALNRSLFASATITSEVAHTGEYSLRLSDLDETRYGAPVYLDHSGSDQYADDAVSIALDQNGRPHMAWAGGDLLIHYASMTQDGHWTDQLPISTNGKAEGSYPKLLMDKNNGAHVIWNETIGEQALYYAYGDSSGNWTEPFTITQDQYCDCYIKMAALDAFGNVHLIWQQHDQVDDSYIYYARRNAAGDWFGPEKINQSRIEYGFHTPQIKVDQKGGIHIAWYGQLGAPGNVYYIYSPDNGITWTDPDQLYLGGNTSVQTLKLAVDADGDASLAWSERGSLGGSYYKDILYAHRSNGAWSTPEVVIPGISVLDDYGDRLILEIANSGKAYILLKESQDHEVYYIHQKDDGSWIIPLVLGEGNFINMVMDNLDTVFLFRTDGGVVTLLKNYANDTYSEEEILPVEAYRFSAVAQDDILHMGWWWAEHSSSFYVTYSGFPLAEQTEAIQYTQTLTVPASMAAPVLSYFYKLDEWFTDDGNQFTVSLQAGSTTQTILSTSDRTDSWAHDWFDLSPWSGQAITITFTAHQTSGHHYLWAYIDEVTVGSARPDVWVSALGAPAALPGDSVTLQLSYGNRSPAVEAISATITAMLPEGLIFESASLTPTVNGNTLSWVVGDVPAGSGPLTILVTARVAGEAPLGSYLTVPVAIAAATPELELVNNQAEYVLYIGGMVYLPVTVR